MSHFDSYCAFTTPPLITCYNICNAEFANGFQKWGFLRFLLQTSPLPVNLGMCISKRTQLEIGALLAVIGLSMAIIAATRFDAFVDCDQRFKEQFEPYLITQARRNPVSTEDNYRMFLHRKMVYEFYPSGSKYSRCGNMLACSSSGLVILAMGAWVCLRARRRV